MKKPELLIPASSLEVLKTAVIFGADAVYIGGEAFGLRAKARNFSMEEMREGIAFAHANHVKVYVTANILAHNGDLSGIREYFRELLAMEPDRPDALIISDPGVFQIAKEVCPQIDIHISTQANNVNYQTFRFWHSLGARRVDTGRSGDRNIRARCHVHFLQRPLPVEQFSHRTGCKPRSMHTPLQMEVFFNGRNASG